MHMDQAGATSEGLVLVRCAGNATGFKGVQAHGNGFRGFYRHGPKGRKALRYTQVVCSANEAARALAEAPLDGCLLVRLISADLG